MLVIDQYRLRVAIEEILSPQEMRDIDDCVRGEVSDEPVGSLFGILLVHQSGLCSGSCSCKDRLRRVQQHYVEIARCL